MQPAAPHTERRLLFDGGGLRIEHLDVRPRSDACGGLECQQDHVLVLPLAGVFAKHDAPGRHVVATPNHALFVPHGQLYRLSFPGALGDQALALRLDTPALVRQMPAAVDGARFEPQALLTPELMLARGLLWQRLLKGGADRLEIEERALHLLGGALQAAARPRRRRLAAPQRLQRQVERVKAAIAVEPERAWTLADLARLASVTPHHLAHVFRREVGAPVYQYVLRARLARALHTVLGSDTELSTVALDAGFASHSHFSARFRALFGRSPNELRKIVAAPRAAAA
jgi:AraC family transcriptional regulator